MPRRGTSRWKRQHRQARRAAKQPKQTVNPTSPSTVRTVRTKAPTSVPKKLSTHTLSRLPAGKYYKPSKNQKRKLHTVTVAVTPKTTRSSVIQVSRSGVSVKKPRKVFDLPDRTNTAWKKGNRPPRGGQLNRRRYNELKTGAK